MIKLESEVECQWKANVLNFPLLLDNRKQLNIKDEPILPISKAEIGFLGGLCRGYLCKSIETKVGYRVMCMVNCTALLNVITVFAQ